MLVYQRVYIYNHTRDKYMGLEWNIDHGINTVVPSSVHIKLAKMGYWNIIRIESEDNGI